MNTRWFVLFILLALSPQISSVCSTTACGIGGNCADPASQPTTCTSCGTLSGLQSYLYPTDTTCYVNCPSDSYKDTSGGTCTLCHASCDGCSGSDIVCLNCASTYYRKIGSSECTQSCGNGYYGDTNTVSCTQCPDGCSQCTMPTGIECSHCATVGGNQYYLSGTNCVSSCPSG